MEFRASITFSDRGSTAHISQRLSTGHSRLLPLVGSAQVLRGEQSAALALQDIGAHFDDQEPDDSEHDAHCSD